MVSGTQPPVYVKTSGSTLKRSLKWVPEFRFLSSLRDECSFFFVTGGAPVGDRRLLSPILSGCIPGSCTYYARAHDSSIDNCLAVHLSLNRIGEDKFDHERCETHETISVAAERLKLRRGATCAMDFVLREKVLRTGLSRSWCSPFSCI